MNPRVHLVTTGGTVGSVRGEGVVGLDPSRRPALLDHVPPDVECGWSSPFSILSEDATSGHWTELARHVVGLPLHRLDAVVVAHGSDTLAWTAAALSFLLRGVPVPVVLTGADLPLADPASNGPDNFRAALAFALGEKLPGVFACWRNPGEDPSIHLGTRLLPADPRTDRFRSASGASFGTVREGAFQRIPRDGNPTRGDLADRADAHSWSVSRTLLQSPGIFDDRVLVLPDQPGLDHSALVPAIGRWRAVLQLAHHSGTASSYDGIGSLPELVRAARASGVPFLLGPSRPTATYESRARLDAIGIRACPDVAWPALVVKIRHLLAIDGMDLLDSDLAWEILSGA